MNNQLETAKYKDLQVEEEAPVQAAMWCHVENETHSAQSGTVCVQQSDCPRSASTCSIPCAHARYTGLCARTPVGMPAVSPHFHRGCGNKETSEDILSFFPGVHDSCWQRLPTAEHSSLQMHETVCFQAALPQQQLDKSSPRFSAATTVAKAKTELKDLIHRARKPK